MGESSQGMIWRCQEATNWQERLGNWNLNEVFLHRTWWKNNIFGYSAATPSISAFSSCLEPFGQAKKETKLQCHFWKFKGNARRHVSTYAHKFATIFSPSLFHFSHLGLGQLLGQSCIALLTDFREEACSDAFIIHTKLKWKMSIELSNSIPQYQRVSCRYLLLNKIVHLIPATWHEYNTTLFSASQATKCKPQSSIMYIQNVAPETKTQTVK